MSSYQERPIMVTSPEEEVANHPHNHKAMIPRDVDRPISSSSSQQMKYGVEKKNGTHFIIPRSLSITWSDDPNYWTWFPIKESSNEKAIEAAELKNVCWLDITGKYDTKSLTPGITYEVVFQVKLEDPAYGWDTPVNLKLALPNGKPQERKVNLREQQRYQWVDIKVGEFIPEKSTAGEITFSMYEHEAGVWKKGLFVKGVEIRPKK